MLADQSKVGSVNLLDEVFGLLSERVSTDVIAQPVVDGRIHMESLAVAILVYQFVEGIWNPPVVHEYDFAEGDVEVLGLWNQMAVASILIAFEILAKLCLEVAVDVAVLIPALVLAAFALHLALPLRDDGSDQAAEAAVHTLDLKTELIGHPVVWVTQDGKHSFVAKDLLLQFSRPVLPRCVIQVAACGSRYAALARVHHAPEIATRGLYLLHELPGLLVLTSLTSLAGEPDLSGAVLTKASQTRFLDGVAKCTRDVHKLQVRQACPKLCC
mmetsp:Transcript_67445/g.108626  ORF Transcript_67445/g.108626 Transcript_67445/m.108626 type:complete len:271 (+) Transcript_67445:293-1105(+)